LNHTTLLNFINKYRSLQKSVNFLQSLLMDAENDSFVKSYIDFYHMGEGFLRNKTIGFNCHQELSLIKYLNQCGAKLVFDPLSHNNRHNFQTYEYYLRVMGFINIRWMRFDDLKDFTKEFLTYYLYEAPLMFSYAKITEEDTLSSFISFLVNCLLNYDLMDNHQWAFCFDIIRKEKLDRLLFQRMTETAKYEYCQTILVVYHKSIYFLQRNNIYEFDTIKHTEPKLWSKWRKLFIDE
jgi:hypothetical protein